MHRKSQFFTRIVALKIEFAAILLLLGALSLTDSVAHAQLAGTGAISGRVIDPSGAVVPNATVTATDIKTNVKTVRVTTNAGDYNITPLTPDTYSVSVSAPGFEQYVQQNVSVDALATVSLNVTLTVGAASQSVTVSTAPPTLETSDATLGGVMDNEVYAGLPLQMNSGGIKGERRATDFEYLIPGVQANSTHNDISDNSGIINGSGPAGGVSDLYIDGLDMPEPDQVGDPRLTYDDFSVDAVNQFQTLTTNFSAEYGGQGVENYSIKSGGNDYHGSIYEYFRNKVLDTWAFTSKVPTLNASGTTVPGGIKPAEVQNEFGIDLSGPILKNKLFLFYNYGQWRAQFGATYQALTIPTAAMLGYTQSGTPLGYADFSGYSAATGYNIYDPATQTPGCSTCTRTQFMGLKNGVATPNVIPGSRISQASNYFNKFLLPYEQLANQSAYVNNITYGRPTGSVNWYQSGRIDYSANSRNQISLIIGFGRAASTGTNQTGAGELGPPFNTSQVVKPNSSADILKDVFTINSHLVNQFAVGYGRYNSFSTTPNFVSQYAASASGVFGFPAGQAAGGFPGITFSGGTDNPSEAGGSTWGGYAWNLKASNIYTFMDNVQWVFGKHNFTLGGQSVDEQYNYYAAITPSGPMAVTFAAAQTGSFSSGTSINSSSGSSVASYMLGAASAGSTTANSPGLGSRWKTPSFWAQDDYKVNSRLTVNMGLRWDIFPAIRESHNIMSFFNPNGQNSITGNRGTLEFAGSGSTAGLYCNCRNPSPIYYGMLQPRLGVAFSVNPKTVVRASYSVNYARGNWNSGSQSGSPSTLGFTPTAAAPAGISSAPAFYWDNTACAQNANNGVACGWTGSVVAPRPPAGGTSLAEYGTGETVALGNSTASSMTYWDPHDGARAPEFLNWSFGFQRQLLRQMSISVSYVGSEGHFISVTQPWYTRNNKLPESLASMAGYNVSGSTAVPCSGANCGYPNSGTGAVTDLIGSKATATNLGLAAGLGYTVPNPYNPANAAYYASNSVYQYYVGFPQFSGLSDTTSFVGNTSWNALEVSLVQRHAYGLDLMLNYTYSKSIDDIGTFRVYDNPRLDRSLSTTDQPQNLAASVVYQSPFGAGKMGGDNFLLRSLAGGWALSSIFTYHSGYPLAFTGSGCGGNGILGTCMPNIVPGQTVHTLSYANPPSGITASSTASNYFGGIAHFNPGAFSVNGNCASGNATSCPGYGTHGGTNNQLFYVGNGPALYIPGNAARVGALNTWGMGTYNVDLGIKRTFPIYERLNFQLEADILNATNHVVWKSPNGVVAGGGFGTITAVANQPRDVQLAGRINW